MARQVDAGEHEIAKLVGERFAFIEGHPTLLGSPYAFERRGESGLWVSELLPHFSSIADDVLMVHSLHTDEFNHAPAQLFLHTGSPRLGRPSMGSWLTYGLGSENDNLPGFIALCPGGYPIKGVENWQAGFLPGIHQGTHIDPTKVRVEQLLENIENKHLSPPEQRRQLDLLRAINEEHADARRHDSALEARLHQ